MPTAKSKRRKGRDRDGALSSLNVVIEALNLAKEATSFTPAKAVFGAVSILLTTIRDSMLNEIDYVELGLACGEVCKALIRGMDGRRPDDLNQSVREAIEQLTTAVVGIQEKITKKGGRNSLSRLAHAKNDKETIASWKLDLNRILHVFSTELAINAHTKLADIHRDILKGQEGADDQHRSTRASIPGESPPPPPRVFFGRDELLEEIVHLAENLTPLALIGVGGIGKTSIALTVLHDNRIKQRFGDERRFIRCDQFPTSLTHFLRRLSKVIGSPIENPMDLTSLRPSLSSKGMFIVLDNAESILDPQGTDAREIYDVVEELSQFSNICVCITSRITTIPPDFVTFDIPTLSPEAARDTFYRIYKNGERSNIINNILERLDFHSLSVTLLATIAHHNKWDADRLSNEWETRRTGALHTYHNKSLAATIELSLTSPTFQELGPDARELLGVIAFFPQGVDENNLEWLFPTVSDGTSILDRFCVLSLAYRINGFVIMLAPLRDHLCPKDPRSSPLLCAARDRYFGRLSVGIYPGKPGYREAQWIKAEDVNIEHLLDVFTSVDADSNGVWDVCSYFMEHLRYHKPRLVLLGPKIEALPDDHPSKPRCMFELSWLFYSVGNNTDRKRLLTHALNLWRMWGDDFGIVQTLQILSDANRLLGLKSEGIQQANEALEICERLDYTLGRALSLCYLAWLLYEDQQLDAAEEAALRSVDLRGEIDPSLVCRCHRLIGEVSSSKGEIEKAVDHFEVALEIASSFGSHVQQFWVHYSLAELFSSQGRYDDSHAHVERAKSHAVNDSYLMGCAMELQAGFWYDQGRLGEAKLEALRAADAFEKVGATTNLKTCRELLCDIEKEAGQLSSSDESDFSAQGTEEHHRRSPEPRRVYAARWSP